MSNRKEELLAMLKSTLALSRSSLKMSLQEQTTTQNPNNDKIKEIIPNVSSNVDEEDEFLYGKSESYDVNNYQSLTSQQKFRTNMEASFDYNHGGSSSTQKNMYKDNYGNADKRTYGDYDQEINYNSIREKNYASKLEMDHDRNYNFGQSAYSTKVLESSKDTFDPDIKQDKKQDQIDSNKLLDTILKTISMDDNLSKIIVEKMKKPDLDAGKINESNKDEVDMTQPMLKENSEVKPGIVAQPIQSIANLSDRYVPMTNFYEVPKQDQYQLAYPSNVDTKIVKSSSDTSDKNSDDSNWNKKTEEFLKKLQTQSKNSREKSRNSKERGDFLRSSPKNKKKSSPHFQRSPSPVKKKRLNDVSPSIKRDSTDSKQDSVEKKTNTEQKNLNDNNDSTQKEIIDTINAVETELEKMEQRRLYLLSKPRVPENENILKMNLKAQQDMKTQLALLKDTLNQLEKEKIKKSNIPSNDKVLLGKNSGQVKRGFHDKPKVPEDESKRKSRSRSRSRGYKKSRSPSYDHKKGQQNDSKSSNYLFHDQYSGKSNRSKSRSRSRSQSRKNDGKSSNSKGNIKPEEKNKIEASTSKVKSESKSMVGDVKFVIELAINLFKKANNFFDGGNLWCQHCNMIFESIHHFCVHLHTEQHLEKSGDGTMDKLSILPRDEPAGPPNAPARGDEFIKPVQAFYCTLCKEYLDNNNKVKTHFTSLPHNLKFKDFIEKHSTYEMPYLARRMNALLAKEKLLKNNEKDSLGNSTDESLDMFEDKNQQDSGEKNFPARKIPIEKISVTISKKDNKDAELETKSVQVKPLHPQPIPMPQAIEPQKPMLLQPFRLNSFPKKNFPVKRS